jgi:hypothetical protein
MTQAWEKAAKAKREAILARIPKEWILDEIPTPEERKDVTGEYVHVKQLLTDREIEITEADAVDIVNKAASRTWTAVEIVKAFCHRAAIAHQLVSSTLIDQPEGDVLKRHANSDSLTAFMRFSLILPSRLLKPPMTISRRTRSPLGPFTVSRSA